MALCAFAHGAPVAETYQVNLNPLIDKAMRHPTQFAVEVARRVDSESTGRWSTDGSGATWDYSLRIPTAVSMAFHASRLMLPAEGTLTVSGRGSSFTVHGRELRRSEFWSRTFRGDQITLHISVPKPKRHQAFLEIAAFQAGYKSLDPASPDNAYYKSLKARSAQTSSCVQNFVCNATPATQNVANASVAITISNMFECSGTLLNDVPQDGTPYVLTARHCENGEPGGGDPGAAASVQVYWNAVTPCGQTLLSIFDSSAQIQSGATTVVEQQDEWLISLESAPVYSGMYYAGWDASGAALDNGYSVDYSGANTQQYVTWAGEAITETFSPTQLGVGFTSTYWGVVNSLGSLDYGGSGSALFNGNNAVVGSASLGQPPGQCPVSPPPVPNPNTVVALYNQLASTWNSTADTTSTTGSATLASVLDPAHTGATTLAGVAGLPPTVTLQVDESSSQTGQSINLQFEGSAGAVCTATGGVAGDGWTGVMSAYPVGTFNLTETAAGVDTYVLTCASVLS
jgi:hypothetical protein